MAVRLESIIYPWTIPEESMYPNSIYFGLKLVSIWVLWGQSIYYVGTWTLRDLKISSLCPSLTAPKCLHAQKMEELLQSEEACDLRQGCSFDGFGFRVLGLDRLDVPNAWGRERERVLGLWPSHGENAQCRRSFCTGFCTRLEHPQTSTPPLVPQLQVLAGPEVQRR